MSMLRYLPLICLLALFTTSCDQPAGTTTAAAADSANPAAGRNGLYIVHIKSDSLQTGYTALANELARMEENANKAQENLTKEGNALQREIAGLQNKAQQGLLSPNQIQSEQQRIARKEQEIMQKREVAIGSIQQEQMELQVKFTEKVREILEALKAENGYDYILNQGSGSGVLVADESHDITELVLERLNAEEVDAMNLDAGKTGDTPPATEQ